MSISPVSIKKWFSSFKITAFCLLLLISTVAFLGYQQRELLKLDSIFREYPDVDELDYHFIAVNFAFKNQFPVLGYLDTPAVYKIRYTPGLTFGVDNMYLNMFKTAGPVLTMRPPLYPLLVGLTYKIFGFHLRTLIWLNIILIAATISLLPYIGFKIWTIRGFFGGLMGSALMFWLMNYNIPTMDIEILGAFLYLIMFYVALLIEKSDLSKYRLLLGVLFGLELLERPTFILLIPLYITFYYFLKEKPGYGMYLKKIAPLVAGIALIILPWNIYIHHQQNETINQRKVWAAKTRASMEYPALFNSKAEIADSQKNTLIALRNFIRTKLIMDIRIGNESIFMGDALLYLNNEYCVNNIADNGCFGWLWKIIRGSYYNTHPTSSNTIVRIIRFYLDNPIYIYKIPLERLRFTTERPLVFWLAPALWGLAVLYRRSNTLNDNKHRNLGRLALWGLFIGCYVLAFSAKIPGHTAKLLMFVPVYMAAAVAWKKNYEDSLQIIYPLFWFSIFSYLFLIYGDMRFTLIILPINCLAIALFSLTFLKFAWEDSFRPKS